MAGPKGGQRTERTLREIYATQCDEFAEALYFCAQAEGRGEVIGARFSDFLGHRANCRECQQLYADALMLLKMEAEEGLAHAPLAVPLPLSLPGQDAPTESSPGWRETVARGQAWLIEATQSATQLVIDLALLVWGNDQPALVLRHGEEDGASVGELTVTPPQDETGYGVEVRLRLLPDVEDSALALLTAEISLPDRWPDFSGIVVALYLPDGERQAVTTGPTGIVRFPRLVRRAIAQMRFAVELPPA